MTDDKDAATIAAQAPLRELVKKWSQFAEMHFERTGAMRPMWYAESADGEGFVIDQPNISKDMAAAMVRALFRASNAVRCVFMDEAWSVKLSEADMAKFDAHRDAGGDVENYPGRQEVIAFMAEDVGLGNVLAHRLIIRPKGGKAHLGPLEFSKPNGRESGRFVGMLPRPKLAS